MNIPIPNLSILDAIHFTAKAWNQVKPNTIISCWLRTQIFLSNFNLNYDNNNIDNNIEEIQQLINNLALDSPLTADEYITIDTTIQTGDILNDNEIIALVRGDEVIEENNNLQIMKTKITTTKAIESIDNLTLFLTQEEKDIDISENFLRELKNVRKKIYKIINDSKVQVEIDSYFS
jgi:hypothetical protein